MRYPLCAAFLFVVAVPLALAEGPSLKEARQRWLKGNYDEAIASYEELAKDEKARVPAVIGLSRALESKGDYHKAESVLDAALKDVPKNADLLARRAELHHTRGRWDEAEKAAEAALAAGKENLLARWVLAQVHRDRGDHAKAVRNVRLIVRYYNDNDVEDAEQLVLIGLAGSENARWHNLSDQFSDILSDFYGEALKKDKDLWQAEYLAGMLLLEKYNRGEALEAFDKALKINPQAAEVLAARGVAALDRFEIKDAEQFAERALKVNPSLPEGLRLRADVHLASGDTAKALKELEDARKINPRDEATLGRIAACFFLQKRTDDLNTLVKEVEKHDPKPGLFYFEFASRLEDRRRFDDAEKLFQKAMELRPQVPFARNSLGMLYMRMGREKEGRETLDKAFEADPFNVKVSNMRKVLKHLDGYETLKTDHFELRFDPKNDRALVRYMADYLEQVYAELAEKFDYKAKGPILIEVFSTHQMFSGRTIALPDLHTIGACTGKMVAMVSPHGKGIRKPFNWSRVLRHELVHIFNLEQTHYQCPHWLTEGLAVTNENFPRPQSWNQLLLKRVPSGELMTLDNVDLGFIRPKSPDDWHMAYCQSQLYVEYMTKTFGKQTVGEMLQAYADGLDTASAIKKVCKVEKAAFEKGYREHLNDVVRSLKGRPAEKAMTLAQLKEAYEKNPNDADITARLAEQQLLRRDKVEARKLAEAALKGKAGHPLASVVKARLLQQAGDVEEARRVLEAAVDRDNPEPKVLKDLGKLLYEAGQFDRAAELYEIGRKAEPHDSDWLTQLARVYAQSENKERLIEVLKDLVPMDADDMEHRKRLARLLSETGRAAEAERYAREALEIDFRDADVRELLLKALGEQKKDAEADRLRKLFEG